MRRVPANIIKVFYPLGLCLLLISGLQEFNEDIFSTAEAVDITHNTSVASTQNDTFVPSAFTMTFALQGATSGASSTINTGATGITSITSPVKGGDGTSDPGGGFAAEGAQTTLNPGAGTFTVVSKLPKARRTETGGSLTLPEVICDIRQDAANSASLNTFIRKTAGGSDITLAVNPAAPTSIFAASDNRRVDTEDGSSATVGNVSTGKNLFIKNVIPYGPGASSTPPSRTLEITLDLAEDS